MNRKLQTFSTKMPENASATVSPAHARDVEMAQPLDGFSGNGEGHAARSRRAACHRFAGFAEYHRQSCPGLFRCRVLGTKDTARVLLQRFRAGVRALQSRAPPLRSSRINQCNLQAKSFVTIRPKPAGTPSLDHLVGAGEQRRRHGKAKRLGGLEVNSNLIFGRRLDR